MMLVCKTKKLSSSGPGPGHCHRLFSKTGLNSCLKRTRAEVIITETPPTKHHQKLFKDLVLVIVLDYALRLVSIPVSKGPELKFIL